MESGDGLIIKTKFTCRSHRKKNLDSSKTIGNILSGQVVTYKNGLRRSESG